MGLLQERLQVSVVSMRLLGMRLVIMVLRPWLWLVASVAWRLDEVYFRMNELRNRLKKKVEKIEEKDGK